MTDLSDIYTIISWWGLAAAFGIAFVAGLIKGTVGFAMPMIMISGLSSIVSPELALAGLILPTLLSNTWQALRQGMAAALASIRSYWLYLSVGGVFLLGSAQLVSVMDQSVLLLLIGVPITAFALLQLFGWRFTLAARSPRVEVGIGAFAGFIGGLSGVWGPPTVAYLTAVNTPKVDQMRLQGTIYGLGAALLFFAHLQSGVLNRATLQWSAMLAPAALIGLACGFWVQDRVNQTVFRQMTLVVLCVAGANLIRRALLG